jgi:hypothetical protein
MDALAWTLFGTLFLVTVVMGFLIQNALSNIVAKVARLEVQIVELQNILKDVDKRVLAVGEQLAEKGGALGLREGLLLNLVTSKVTGGVGSALISGIKRLVLGGR